MSDKPMSNTAPHHLDEDRLLALALGMEVETEEDSAHLRACLSCRDELLQERELSAALVMMPVATPPPDFVARTTERFAAEHRARSVRGLLLAGASTLLVGLALALSLAWRLIPQLGDTASVVSAALTQGAALVSTLTVLASVFPSLAACVAIGALLTMATSASLLTRLARATAK